MKRFNLIICFTFYAILTQAQTNEQPLQNRNTKTNINTTNNNSNSGVNPNGNPGTIISSSAISGGNPPTNISPYPPAPPVNVIQEPQINTETTEIDNPVQETAPQVSTTPVIKKEIPAEPLEVVEVKRVSKSGKELKVVNIPSKNKQTFRPVYQTYIPQNIVEDIKKKFGDNVYDIILLNSKSGKQVYIIRIAENGVFRTETLSF